MCACARISYARRDRVIIVPFVRRCTKPAPPLFPLPHPPRRNSKATNNPTPTLLIPLVCEGRRFSAVATGRPGLLRPGPLSHTTPSLPGAGGGGGSGKAAGPLSALLLYMCAGACSPFSRHAPARRATTLPALPSTACKEGTASPRTAAQGRSDPNPLLTLVPRRINPPALSHPPAPTPLLFPDTPSLACCLPPGSGLSCALGPGPAAAVASCRSPQLETRRLCQCVTKSSRHKPTRVAAVP